jgi:hypothetical protein
MLGVWVRLKTNGGHEKKASGQLATISIIIDVDNK